MRCVYVLLHCCVRRDCAVLFSSIREYDAHFGRRRAKKREKRQRILCRRSCARVDTKMHGFNQRELCNLQPFLVASRFDPSALWLGSRFVEQSGRRRRVSDSRLLPGTPSLAIQAHESIKQQVCRVDITYI